MVDEGVLFNEYGVTNLFYCYSNNWYIYFHFRTSSILLFLWFFIAYIAQLTIRQFGPVIEINWSLKQFFYYRRIWESGIGKHYDILRRPMLKVGALLSKSILIIFHAWISYETSNQWDYYEEFTEPIPKLTFYRWLYSMRTEPVQGNSQPFSHNG